MRRLAHLFGPSSLSELLSSLLESESEPLELSSELEPLLLSSLLLLSSSLSSSSSSLSSPRPQNLDCIGKAARGREAAAGTQQERARGTHHGCEIGLAAPRAALLCWAVGSWLPRDA
jgi:hypothetical protein